MGKIIILGSGAAPGVPSIANGWGDCNPNNPKNRRSRTGTYIEIGTAKILIDTSPDMRLQLLENGISHLDAVLYTHAHADHLHGIDDLRDINRISGKPLDIYGTQDTLNGIQKRFPYLLTDKIHPNNPLFRASLVANLVKNGESFKIKDTEIIPLAQSGHALSSNGYIFNGGEIVYVSDCRKILPEGLKIITKKPKLLILPLTTITPQNYHMGLKEVLQYIKLIDADKTIINHMAVECDYDAVNKLTPDNTFPAYDNMIIEF